MLLIIAGIGYIYLDKPPDPQVSVSHGVIKPVTDTIKEPEPQQATGGEPKPEPTVIVKKATIKKSEELVEIPEWTPNPPMVCMRITQGYHSYHRALDLVTTPECKRATSVFAVDDGIITYTGYDSIYGYRIEITHTNGFITTYSHLSETDYEKDKELKRGNKIGTMGNTGYSSGQHLHFEIYDPNGKKVNPYDYIGKYFKN